MTTVSHQNLSSNDLLLIPDPSIRQLPVLVHYKHAVMFDIVFQLKIEFNVLKLKLDIRDIYFIKFCIQKIDYKIGILHQSKSIYIKA